MIPAITSVFIELNIPIVFVCKYSGVKDSHKSASIQDKCALKGSFVTSFQSNWYVSRTVSFNIVSTL